MAEIAAPWATPLIPVEFSGKVIEMAKIEEGGNRTRKNRT